MILGGQKTMNIYLIKYVGGCLHKIYMDFGISGILVVEEAESERVKEEYSKLIANFLKDKKVVELQNTFSSVSENDFAELQAPIGEA